MFKSAVYKLTLFYIVLAISLSLFFSGVLFYFTHNELKEGLISQYSELTYKEKDSIVFNHKVVNQDLEKATYQLLLKFIYLNFAILILSAIIGYLLAKRTLKPIQQSLVYQTHFAEEASHELKTPLSAIKASSEAELLTNKNNSKSFRKVLRDNIKDIDKLQNLINYLLELAREGKINKESKEYISVTDIINQTIRTLKPKARAKNITFTKNFSNQKILANPVAIRQLMIIILDNALKYSNKNSAVEITIKELREMILISIKDFGVGIAKKELKNIFKRFYQANIKDINYTNKEGFGLGLYIAKEIVKNHDGKIKIRSILSEPSETTVEILLPK